MHRPLGKAVPSDPAAQAIPVGVTLAALCVLAMSFIEFMTALTSDFMAKVAEGPPCSEAGIAWLMHH